MLILAGVAISMAVGENGVIERTQEALKENERADVQEIIIGSYVFKVTGATNTFAYIDIPKTGIAIYENLTANGFTVLNPQPVKDENNNDVMSAPITKDENENPVSIDINVKGDHGIYEGTVDKEGLTGDLIPQPEDDDIIIGGKTDLEKLREYFVGNVIYNPSENTGLYNFEDGTFIPNDDLTDADEIILNFPQIELNIGDTADIFFTYKETNYCVTIEVTGENEESILIKGKNVKVSEPKLEDLELLRKCMKDKEVTEEMIGKEQTFTHEDGDSVKVLIDATMFVNSETEAMVKISYNGAQYMSTILTGEKAIISDVNYLPTQNSNFKYNEFYISEAPMSESSLNSPSCVAITINENGDMKIYCIDTEELNEEMPRAIKINGNNIYRITDGNIYYRLGSISEDGNVLSITIEGETVNLNYSPNFKIPSPPPEISSPYVYYEKIDPTAEASMGVLVKDDNSGFMLLIGENSVLPFFEVEYIPGPQTVMVNGNAKTINNPVFMIQPRSLLDRPNEKIKVLFGSLIGNKFIAINVEYDSSSDSNFDSQGFVKDYKKVQKSMDLLKAEFTYDKADVNKIFESEENEGSIIGLNEKENKLYIGYIMADTTIWSIGPAEYEIKEDFVAKLDDGTTVDYSGKKVIFAPEVSDAQFEKDEISPIGYIDGNKFVMLETNVSNRDENGVATSYVWIREGDTYILK